MKSRLNFSSHHRGRPIDRKPRDKRFVRNLPGQSDMTKLYLEVRHLREQVSKAETLRTRR